jgi:hypothetical protein
LQIRVTGIIQHFSFTVRKQIYIFQKTFIAKGKHQIYINESDQECENKCSEYEIYDLFFKFLLEKIKTINYIPHYMGNNDTHQNKNSYPGKKKNALIFRTEFIK